MRSAQLLFCIVPACLTIGGESFTPALKIPPLNAPSRVKFRIRQLRIAPRASYSGECYSLASAAADFFLAFDSDGSKNYQLYNGVPAAAAVVVCRSILLSICFKI